MIRSPYAVSVIFIINLDSSLPLENLPDGKCFLNINDDICLLFCLLIFNQTIPLMMALVLQVIIVQALINNVSKTFTLNNTSSVCFFCVIHLKSLVYI
jgi:hypothetical protein